MYLHITTSNIRLANITSRPEAVDKRARFCTATWYVYNIVHSPLKQTYSLEQLIASYGMLPEGVNVLVDITITTCRYNK